MMNQKKKTLIIALLAFLILLLAGGAVFYFVSQSGGQKKVTKNTKEETGSLETEEDDGEDEGDLTLLFFGDDIYTTGDKIQSYLFIGTDESGTGADTADTPEYKGDLADFLLLAVYNKTQNTIGFLQIDRNTITDVDVLEDNNEAEGAATEQICTAHWYGTNPEAGCENTVNAVDYLLGGLEIDGYYAVGMENIGLLNHLAGGVEVTLTDDFSAEDPSMTKGTTLTLNDTQAELYVRGRMSVADGTNANRMARQKTYLTGLLAKMKTKVQTDPGCINDIFKELNDIADTNLKSGKISKLAVQMEQAEDLGIFTLDGKTKTGTTLGDGELHEEFYPTEKSMIRVMSSLMNLKKDEE